MALAWLQWSADPVDARFYQHRLSFGLAKLQQYPLPVSQAVPLVVSGQPNERIVFGLGWSAPEAWGVWTNQAQALLFVRLPDKLPCALRLHVEGAVNLGVRQQDHVDVALGKHDPARFDLHAPEFHLDLPVSPAWADADRVLRIAFQTLPPAMVPGSRDPRQLGLAVRSIGLFPGPGSTTATGQDDLSCSAEMRP